MLLKDNRGRDACFKTMRCVSLYNFAKRAHRAALAFPVVRHFRKPTLYFCRRVQSLNQLPFSRGEGVTRRRRVHAMEVTQTLRLCKRVEVTTIRVSDGIKRQ